MDFTAQVSTQNMQTKEQVWKYDFLDFACNFVITSFSYKNDCLHLILIIKWFCAIFHSSSSIKHTIENIENVFFHLITSIFLRKKTFSKHDFIQLGIFRYLPEGNWYAWCFFNVTVNVKFLYTDVKGIRIPRNLLGAYYVFTTWNRR